MTVDGELTARSCAHPALTGRTAAAVPQAIAGRPAFLPGGWQAARAPRTPGETWKLSMHEAPQPVPQMFRTAWGRVTEGDVPRYHDLEENR